MGRFIDMTGKRFGCWLVVEQTESRHGNAYYVCRCECGTERSVAGYDLRSEKSTSCGCERARQLKERRTTHGLSGSSTYASWSAMIQRCTNPNRDFYPDYGGRGIQVCERWQLFENFLADMGEKPKKGMSIERLDPDGNYEPINCVWANNVTQSRNRRNGQLTAEIVRDLRSGKLSISDAVERYGFGRSVLYAARNGRTWKDVV